MTKVKICGLTDLRDALKAHELGADFIGFIFFKESPRTVEAEHARVIIEDLPEGVPVAGLFYNQDLEYVRRTAQRCHIKILQLHGDEDPEYCRALKRDFQIIKSFKIKDDMSIGGVNGYEETDFYLFDTYVKGTPGGTGKSFNWDIVKGKTFKKPVFLAGGLTPQNVAGAIRAVRPYAVDVASGVERSPGKKDYGRLKEFIDNAKKA
jgi:phosphoribosylanthranilate isomerase